MHPIGEWIERRPRIVLAVAAVACLTPFLNKAYHIDDPLFLMAAKQIQLAPRDFYGFNVNWYGTWMAMDVVTQNPPLTCYYLAAAAWLLGWSEPALHAAMMPLAIAVVLGTYELGRRCCRHPMHAAFLALAAPVFLVSATGVMCDVMLLALWTWSVVLWMQGLECGKARYLAASGVLAALAVLTKYYGAALAPLLAAYTIARGVLTPQRETGVKKTFSYWQLLWLLLPVVALGVYQLVTLSLYGRAMFSEAMTYALDRSATESVAGLARVGVAVSFVGGCLLFPLTLLPWLFGWRGRLSLAAAGLAVMLMSQSAGANLSAPWNSVAAGHMAFFGAAGAVLIAAALAYLHRHRDATAWLLILWILGTLLFAGFINWTINARSVLPMVPAAAVLMIRRIEAAGQADAELPRGVSIGTAVCLAFSLLVATGDAALANTDRTAAQRLFREASSQAGAVWFQGHWGFQFYMSELGALPVDFSRSVIATRDAVVIPMENTNLQIPGEKDVTDAIRMELVTKLPVSTMRAARGAGFYSHRWGPLPYVFGSPPALVYDVVWMKPIDGEASTP